MVEQLILDSIKKKLRGKNPAQYALYKQALTKREKELSDSPAFFRNLDKAWEQLQGEGNENFSGRDDMSWK